MIHDRPSPNHGERPAGTVIDMLVLHYTGMADARAALDRLCDPAARVSAHWLVDEDGAVWRLVPEDRRAWHAGVAAWAGRGDINSCSIGIELVNPGHDGGYRPFPPAQMKALTALARDVLARHPIPPWLVVGHSDIAPDRKRDPGELFDWAGLAAQGIGLWPDTDPAVSADPPGDLAAIGYAGSDAAVVAAFQRRFRPRLVDGVPDDDTRKRIAAVAAAYRHARDVLDWAAPGA